jgi:hypothetical protein
MLRIDDSDDDSPEGCLVFLAVSSEVRNHRKLADVPVVRLVTRWLVQLVQDLLMLWGW